jgi:MerR family redox-sensitive transcriptional activator SoxR
MEGLSIGEIARRAGVRPSAIRYYESVGLLPQPHRVNGQRRYGDDILELLAAVKIAQRAGFTVAEARTLLHGFSPDTPPSARWQVLAREKLPEIEALISRAIEMRCLLRRGLRCECLRLEDCDLVSADQ